MKPRSGQTSKNPTEDSWMKTSFLPPLIPRTYRLKLYWSIVRLKDATTYSRDLKSDTLFLLTLYKAVKLEWSKWEVPSSSFLTIEVILIPTNMTSHWAVLSLNESTLYYVRRIAGISSESGHSLLLKLAIHTKTNLTRLVGRAIAQAVSRQFLTAEARVPNHVSPCRICGGQSGTWDRFILWVLRFFPVSIIPPMLHIHAVSWGMDKGPVRGPYSHPIAIVTDGNSFAHFNMKLLGTL
jgi:hypothetical protein